jgi:serine/threonine-protein kinase RsbW
MNGDVVKIGIPAKPDYILAVRLAISAVAERAGFNIEDIEDLKVAAAEACMLLLAGHNGGLDINITVKDGLQIDFVADGEIKNSEVKKEDNETGDLSQYLLEALVDKCDFCRQQDELKSVSFYKKL